MIGRASLALAGLAALCLTACQAPPAPPAPTPAPPEPVARPAPAPVPAKPPETASRPTPAPPAVVEPMVSSASSVDGFKRDFAARVLRMNPHLIFDGRLPEMLYAVVVLEVTVNASGHPTRVNVMRTPGYARELGTVAADSVRRAAPMQPAAAVLRGARELTFTETWLFREDGKFQIRTLAGRQ